MLETFFILSKDIPSNVANGEYSVYLVLLSYIIATLASYTGLTLANKIYLARSLELKNLLHVGAAFALGSGIWSMHFVGMLAYKVPMPVSYDLEHTFLSMVIALVSAAAVLGVARVSVLKWQHVFVSAVLLGLSIALMHYVGMRAMRMEARIFYEPIRFGLSLLVAITASGAALGLFFYFGRQRNQHIILLRILAAMILGLGICGMHYIGMAAANFLPVGQVCTVSDIGAVPAINREMLALAVTLMTGLVVVLALTISIYNQEQKSLHNQLQNDIFPIRLITLSVFLTFFTILTLGGFSARVSHQMEVETIRGERMHGLALAYLSLDKRLSNSLSLYAITRHQKWGDTYLTLAFEQQQVLRQLKEILRTGESNQFSEFDEIEEQRSRMDREILGLVGNRQQATALNVLQSDEYQEIKRNYEAQFELVAQEAMMPVESRKQQFIDDDYMILFFSLLAAVLLSIFWYFAFRSVRRWQKQIVDNRNDLNARYLEKEALEKRMNVYIEEVKRARDRALRAMHEADHANKAKTDFLTNMSHELRTPMNSILGLTELLLKNEKTIPEHKELLAVILEAGETLLKIVNDVLDIAKIEADGLSLQRKPFNLQAMLNNVLNTLKPMAIEKELHLSQDFDSQIITLVEDELRITRVFTNLLANAIKYTDYGSIHISAHVAKKDGDYVLRGVVTDTGIGIPKDKLEVIFEKFSQADNSITRKYGGTGLGLAITKELIELMNGEIGVESTVGKGSKFWIEIPVEVSVFTPQEETKTRPLRIKAFDAVGRIPIAEARILIAEDHPLNQVFMQTLFTELGFSSVLLANDGQQVLDVLNVQRVDVVLMDCLMPELNGYETTARIRETEKNTGEHLPIIAMTARAMVGDRQRCLDSGMDDYISKPVDLESLKKILSRWIIMDIDA